MRVVATLPVVMLLAGCASSPSGSADATAGLAYTVQPAPAAGRTATVALRNGGAAPMGYNLCIAALEQLRGPLWIPALSAANACPDAWSTLEPGQQATAEASLPAGLGPGDYRFVTQVKAPAGSFPVVQVRSDPFSIAQ